MGIVNINKAFLGGTEIRKGYLGPNELNKENFFVYELERRGLSDYWDNTVSASNDDWTSIEVNNSFLDNYLSNPGVYNTSSFSEGVWEFDGTIDTALTSSTTDAGIYQYDSGSSFEFSYFVSLQRTSNTQLGSVLDADNIGTGAVSQWAIETKSGGYQFNGAPLTPLISYNTLNTWHSIAFTVNYNQPTDTLTFKGYLNGELQNVSSTAYSGSGLQNYSPNSIKLNLGGIGSLTGATNEFNGYIKDVALYTSSLSDAEVYGTAKFLEQRYNRL